jgi:hypothetical protein
MSDSQQTAPERTLSAAPDAEKPKKARVARTGPKASSTSGGDAPRKRGPPRPHRKLPQEVLEGRICKLRKRIERARGQLEDAERHIDAYDKEAKYREQEKKE